MKKLITILLILMVGFVSKAQFPFRQTVSNSSTLYYIRGGTGVDSTLVFAVSFADTAAANLGYLDNIAGAVIRTSDNILWLRNNDANTWVEIGSGGASYTFQYSITESGGSVNLVNDVASPGNNKYYGTNSSGTRNWYDSPVFNLTTPVDGQPIIYYDGEFINADKNRNISFTVGDVGYPSAGQSTYTNANLINTIVQVYREGDLMSVNTTTGITFVSGTGVITFYPNLSPLEKIIIIVTSPLVWY